MWLGGVREELRHTSRPFQVLICLLLVLSGIAASGSMAAGPRPDPPPLPQPPPPPSRPVYRPPPPPVFRPPPPPVSSGPSAAQIAAARRASAARARAARLRAQRAKAARARKVAARARAARLRAKRLEARREAARNKAGSPRALPEIPRGLSKPGGSPSAFAFFSLGVAVLLLGLALVPAHAVPWYWVSRALEDRRGELALFGALGFGVAFFFLLQAR